MRTILGFALVTAAACGGEITNDSGDNDNPGGPDACVGLECEVAKCTGAGQTPTTLTGTVFAPNGTLPLYGVDVFVPRDALPDVADGVTCGACQELPGSPIVETKTDTNGNFVLENVPAGVDIPLVMSIGKWRRVVTIPAVTECTSTPVSPTMTSLPKNKTEGSIPKIAVTTGDADSMECLFLKMGIDSSEITTSAGAGRVHLYHGDGGDRFASGGGTFTEATPFWSSATNLLQYDIVVLSCEGEQGSDTKPQAALEALQDYADAGGRVFASHWHNIWIGGNFQENGNIGIPSWEAVANWEDGVDNPPETTIATIDQSANPKGAAFAEWMVNVGGSTNLGKLPIKDGRITARSVNGSAERWVYLDPADGGGDGVQNFQFTTPIENPADQRCGKVVFSDMHVSGDPGGNGDYPNYCINPGQLSPQEKALIFMMFDIASCVSVVGKQ